MDKGEGVQKSENFADTINGNPLTEESAVMRWQSQSTRPSVGWGGDNGGGGGGGGLGIRPRPDA